MHLARHGSRQYKVGLRCKHHFTGIPLRMIAENCLDSAGWAFLPAPLVTSDVTCQYFRHAAKVAANINRLLVVPESAFPFRLFLLLDATSEEEIRSVHADLVAYPCTWDPVSRDYLEEYNTVDALGSPEARAELVVMAMQIDLDISRIESKWCRLRRIIKTMSMNGPGARMETISAVWKLKGLRSSSSFLTQPGQNQRGKSTQFLTKKTKRRYHAWQAFCRDEWRIHKARA